MPKAKRSVKAEDGDVNGDSSPKKTKKGEGSMTGNKLPGKDWYERTPSKIFIGAHVSMSGGVYNALDNSAAIGGRALGLFLCNQRTWNVKPLDDKDAEMFRKRAAELGYPLDLILPHASYLMNPGSPDNEMMSKSRQLFLDGFKRCEKLGIKLYNFHPGSHLDKISVSQCLDRIAESINYVHANTNGVVAVIENMSKQGNTVGGDFKELKGIIDRVKDKTRVGVCFDTCHAFAAGCDLRSDVAYEKTMQEFDTMIGFKYLRGVHLNDSKGVLGSHLDRHECIGKGQLGLKVFARMMKDERFKNVPIILETPTDMEGYAKEIALLYKTMEADANK